VLAALPLPGAADGVADDGEPPSLLDRCREASSFSADAAIVVTAESRPPTTARDDQANAVDRTAQDPPLERKDEDKFVCVHPLGATLWESPCPRARRARFRVECGATVRARCHRRPQRARRRRRACADDEDMDEDEHCGVARGVGGRRHRQADDDSGGDATDHTATATAGRIDDDKGGAGARAVREGDEDADEEDAAADGGGRAPDDTAAQPAAPAAVEWLELQGLYVGWWSQRRVARVMRVFDEGFPVFVRCDDACPDEAGRGGQGGGRDHVAGVDPSDDDGDSASSGASGALAAGTLRAPASEKPAAAPG
jgi:hypothetical protein